MTDDRWCNAEDSCELDDQLTRRKDMTPVPRLYTTEEVADLLHLSVRTVRVLIQERKMKAINLGREYRISEEQLMEFLKERETK